MIENVAEFYGWVMGRVNSFVESDRREARMHGVHAGYEPVAVSDDIARKSRVTYGTSDEAKADAVRALDAAHADAAAKFAEQVGRLSLRYKETLSDGFEAPFARFADELDRSIASYEDEAVREFIDEHFAGNTVSRIVSEMEIASALHDAVMADLKESSTPERWYDEIKIKSRDGGYKWSAKKAVRHIEEHFDLVLDVGTANFEAVVFGRFGIEQYTRLRDAIKAIFIRAAEGDSELLDAIERQDALTSVGFTIADIDAFSRDLDTMMDDGDDDVPLAGNALADSVIELLEDVERGLERFSDRLDTMDEEEISSFFVGLKDAIASL